MNSKETINGVADETDSWTEGLAKLKNQVMVAAEPIATTLFDALNKLVPLIEKAVPPLQKMADSFANMPQGVQVAIVAFAALLALMGPLLQGIGAIVIAAPGLAAAFTVMTGPIGLAVVAIAALIAIIVLLYKKWKENGEKSKELIKAFAENVKQIFEDIKTWLANTWENIKQKFEDAWNNIKDFFKKWGDEILLIAVGPAGWAVLLGRKIAENWDSIKAKTSEVWNNIKTAITRPIESAKQTVLGIITSIKNAFANMRITIPTPKLPHISVSTKYKSVGNVKVPYPDFDLNWYKTGGIFDRPSIIGVGEAGTEAVIPLDKMPGLIADALRDAMGGGQVAMAGGITVQNMYVRNDQDIKLIARELYNLQQTNARGRGLR